jgi:hypothetical protein
MRLKIAESSILKRGKTGNFLFLKGNAHVASDVGVEGPWFETCLKRR